jgi:hypothetical protein
VKARPRSTSPTRKSSSSLSGAAYGRPKGMKNVAVRGRIVCVGSGEAVDAVEKLRLFLCLARSVRHCADYWDSAFSLWGSVESLRPCMNYHEACSPLPPEE